MVNHSLHFVDPKTGVHTNNIESTWKTCQMKIKQMCGNAVKLIRLIFGYIISLFPIKRPEYLLSDILPIKNKINLMHRNASTFSPMKILNFFPKQNN